MSSINTNLGALGGLDRLNQLSTQYARLNKQVSTGLSVADATDNGAVFAIAQGLRSDTAALSAVNGQLGAARGAVNVATAAATGVSNSLSDLRQTLLQLADPSVTGAARSQLQAQYASQTQQIAQQVGGASYNGTNLIGPGAQNQSVIQDLSAGQLTIQAQDLNAGAAALLTPVSTASQAASLLSGGFQTAVSNVGTALNSFAASGQAVTNQINANVAAADATDQGLGSLVDADLAKAAALSTSRAVQLRLASTSLSIANAAPKVLTSLLLGS